MSLATEKIGLFPLNMVLFPTSVIPLHIFEDRYKELINKCLKDRSYFGINLVIESSLSRVGCTARVVEKLHEYDDGKMDIVVSGGRRYHLHSVDEKEQAYLVGHVEYFDDDPPSLLNENLFDECVTMYNKIVEVVFNGDGELALQHSAGSNYNFSFLMAQKAGLQLQQKQALLEMVDENSRLEFLYHHFQDLLPKINQAEQIQTVIKSDGYFVQPRGTGNRYE